MALYSKDLGKAKAQTKAVYERQAEVWDKCRVRVFYERPWLERMASHLSPGARILDLGCGAGDPIAAWFIAQGYHLTGLDYSAPMLDMAKSRYPEGGWILGDMRQLPGIGPFDVVISWDGFFHLDMDEQRAFLRGLPDLVAPGGAVLFTVGRQAGEVIGHVGGETVYHASLSTEEYRHSLTEAGFGDVTLVANDAETEGRTILMAVRSLKTFS